MKRILIAMFFGLVVGSLCATAVFKGNILPYSMVALIFVLLNRVIMGFAIGVSGLHLHWTWNGIVIGILVGSIFSYFLFMQVGPTLLPLFNFFVNGIFGLVIEFFTTVVFRAPAPAGVQPAKPVLIA